MTQGHGRHLLFHRIDGIDAIADLVHGTDMDVLRRLDDKPALLQLPGTDSDSPTRFISVLLHGNEDSGFRGLCAWLRGRPRPPGDVWIFIGNVRAATTDGEFAHRYLDDQEDFNRVWGIRPATTRMRRCAAEVLEIITRQPLDAALDIHNNTGENPFYAILPSTSAETFELAGTLTDLGLLWGTQSHTLMQALGRHCPAIAVECGRAGVPANAEGAREVIERFIAAPRFDGSTARRPTRLFQVTHRVEVRPEVAFAFGPRLTESTDLMIREGLDGHNFGMLLAGTTLGETLPGADPPLIAIDLDGEDATSRFFDVDGQGLIRTREDVSPAMMTRSPEQTRRDCLFYVVRRRI